MTERELRRLGKTDLLTILRDQQSEIEALGAEKARLQEELQGKTIDLEQSGSIAEAALALNGVFQSAQRAADQYLASVRAREADLERRLGEREAAAAREILEKRDRAEAECRAREADAQRQSEQLWQDLEQKLERYYDSHAGLKELLHAAGIDLAVPARRSGQAENALEKD